MGIKKARIAILGMVCKIPTKEISLSAIFCIRENNTPRGTATITPSKMAAADTYRCSHVLISKSFPCADKKSTIVYIMHYRCLGFVDIESVAPNSIVDKSSKGRTGHNTSNMVTIINHRNIFNTSAQYFINRITKQAVFMHG